MKFIRTLLAALTLTAVSLGANAQFRYGPVVGGSVTKYKFKQDLVELKQQLGGHAGVQAEMMFPGVGFGMEFGLLYYLEGGKVNLGQKPIWAGSPQLGIAGFGNETVMIHNLQIPFHVRFKWTRMNGLEEIVAPFFYGGPDFNIQVGHSAVKAGDRKAFRFSGGDVGLTVGLGAELLQHYQVSAGYTWGMTYALKTRLLDQFSARLSGWQFRVAYLF